MFSLIINFFTRRKYRMTPTEIIDMVLKHEGGYVNHPNDPGGITNMGITLGTYQRYYPDATGQTIRDLTREQAIEFYHKNFYEKFHVELLPVEVQDIYMDMLVNHGPGNAGKILQRGIKASGVAINVDGRVGPKTRKAALKAVQRDVEDLREAINDARQHFYNRIVANRPEMSVFAKGWRNRVNSFRHG